VTPSAATGEPFASARVTAIADRRLTGRTSSPAIVQYGWPPLSTTRTVRVPVVGVYSPAYDTNLYGLPPFSNVSADEFRFTKLIPSDDTCTKIWSLIVAVSPRTAVTWRTWFGATATRKSRELPAPLYPHAPSRSRADSSPAGGLYPFLPSRSYPSGDVTQPTPDPLYVPPETVSLGSTLSHPACVAAGVVSKSNDPPKGGREQVRPGPGPGPAPPRPATPARTPTR
jgi:hypothetical protein